MFNTREPGQSSIRCNESTEGEFIEAKVRRIMDQNEPITDGAPLLYTERKNGVMWETDIRTDRFDKAIEATDLIQAQKLAKREEILKAKSQTETPKGEV